MKNAKEDIDKLFPKEHCVCAAIKLVTGEVVRGRRHDDCFKIVFSRDGEKSAHWNAIQGFITSIGRFVDRIEGMIIQRETGIPSKFNITGEYIGDELFSEDLY